MTAIRRRRPRFTARNPAAAAARVIKDEPIYYPKVTCPDVLLCLSQEAYNKYAADIKPDGTLIIDSDFVQPAGLEGPGVKVCAFPIVETARTRLNNEMSANVVALGAIVGVTHIVSDAAVERALANNFKAAILPGNIAAYHAGYDLAQIK